MNLLANLFKTKEDKISEISKAIREQINKGNKDKAYALLDEAFKNELCDRDMCLLLADFLIERENYTKAHEVIQTVEYAVCTEQYWYLKGLARETLEEYGEAVYYYQRALKINPENEKLKTVLAKAYLKVNGHEYEAIELIEKLKNIEEKEVLLKEYGEKLYSNNKFKEAEDIYLKLCRIEASIDNYERLVSCQKNLGKYESVINTAKKGLELDETNDYLQLQLGIVFYIKEDYLEAIKSFKSLEPDKLKKKARSDYYFYYPPSLFQSNQLDKALSVIDRDLSENPNSFHGLFQKAIILYNKS